MAVLLKLSPYGKGDEVHYEVRVDVRGLDEASLEQRMQGMGLNPVLQTVSSQPEDIKRLRYEMKLPGEDLISQLYQDLLNVEGVENVRISRSIREQEL